MKVETLISLVKTLRTAAYEDCLNGDRLERQDCANKMMEAADAIEWMLEEKERCLEYMKDELEKQVTHIDDELEKLEGLLASDSSKTNEQGE